MEKEAFEAIVTFCDLKRNPILQGPPGAGKSFTAQRLAYALIQARDMERVQFIQFHQSYSYEDFIEGYRTTGKGRFREPRCVLESTPARSQQAVRSLWCDRE